MRRAIHDPTGASWVASGSEEAVGVLAIDAIERYAGSKPRDGVHRIIWLFSGVNALGCAFYIIITGPGW